MNAHDANSCLEMIIDSDPSTTNRATSERMAIERVNRRHARQLPHIDIQDKTLVIHRPGTSAPTLGYGISSRCKFDDLGTQRP